MGERESRHRFFVESLSGERVALPEGEARHALTVLRLAAGTGVELFDGAGTLAEGVLEPAGRKGAAVRVERRQAVARPEPHVELAFAVPKAKRLDWLLEKATELGAARLAPVVFARSVATPELSAHAQSRWRAICIAAAKQSGAVLLPELAEPALLARYLSSCRAEIRMVGSPAKPVAGDEQPTLRSLLAAWRPGQGVAILIGPEGGLTDSEQSQAESARFVPVHLGRLVLRVETAAVALLAACAVLAGF